MKPARFWPLAAIIILPVLVLAGVAAYGLAQVQTARRAEASELCEVSPLLREWMLALRAAAMASPPVVLYQEPPLPSREPAAESNAGGLSFGEMNAAALEAEMRRADGLQYVDSGLPARVLAGWEWMQRQPERGGSMVDADGVDYFMRLVLLECPSVISEVILRRMSVRFPGRAADWQKVWEESEVRRAALKLVNSGTSAGGQRAAEEIVVLGLRDGRRPEWLGPAQHHGLRFARATCPGGLVMVFTGAGDGGRVLLEDEWRPVFLEMQERTRRMLPAWAGADVRIKQGRFASARDSLVLSESREALAEVLSEAREGPFVMTAGPREKDWLLRDYYRLVWWTCGIIGGALGTALLGLWLIKRTLNKERRLGELKSQFVSSVSHELRAPIGSLRLMAEGLATGRVKGEAAGEFHRLMAGEGARLSALIENVLDFARIEQGRKEYVMAETDVAALLGDAVALMQPQAEAKGLLILLECASLPSVPRVDAGALQQAVVNLLDNAVKFTPGRPAGEGAGKSDASGLKTIRVRLAAEADGWSITVTDPGIGIPREEHARIFERFYRLGNELRRETTGTGIGLAIVKHIVEGHGGKVTVRSEEGRGSEFRMEFGRVQKEGFRQPPPVPDSEP